MISPLDIISEIERNAKNLIKKGDFIGAKKLLENALESIRARDFLDLELPDLVIILKKIHSDFLTINDFEGGFQSLTMINKIMKGKINLNNELKNYLNKLPPDFDVSKYDSEIRQIAGNNWEILELLKIIEENYRKDKSN